MGKVLVSRLFEVSRHGHVLSNSRIYVGRMQAGGSLKGETVMFSMAVAKSLVCFLQLSGPKVGYIWQR